MAFLLVSWDCLYPSFRPRDRGMPIVASVAGKMAYGRPQRTQTAIVSSNLQIYLDAANNASYPGSGTTWSNIGPAGTSYNFTLTNGPVSSNVTYNGQTNRTIFFDGTNDYTTPNTSLLSLAQANSWQETREYWVYWRGSPGCLTMESGVGTPDTNWYDAQAAMSNTTLTYSVWQGGPMTAYPVFNALTSNTWNHIIWQHNKATNTLLAYVNGTRTYSNASIARTTPDSAGYGFYTILCAGTTTNFGSGSASYLGASLGLYRWYNRVITSNEIAQNYATERTRFGR